MEYLMNGMRQSRQLVVLLALMTLTLAGPVDTLGQTVATDFALKDIDGKQFSLSDFRGRIILLDFFATWCGPCKEEMPQLRTLSNLYKNDRLVIVSITVDPAHDTESTLRTFVKDHGITWTVARDIAGVTGKYGVNTIPTLVLIDQSGYVKNRRVGITSSGELQTMIESTGTISEKPAIAVVIVAVAAVTIVLAVVLILIWRKEIGHAKNQSS